MCFRRSWLILASLVCLFCFTHTSYAADEDSSSSEPVSAGELTSLAPEPYQEIKRQIMSKPGVFLDMSALTDKGYVWSNDAIWEGADLPTNEKWHIAGFLFQRPKYKGVWLQYAFTVDDTTGNVESFQRWYGAGGFR